MRILVEPSEIVLRNAGDSAMLIVALRRLRGEFPDARITVLTEDVEALRAHAPDVEPLSARGRDTWAADLLLFYRLRRLPSPLLTAIRGIAHALRRHAPALVRALLRAKTRIRGRSSDELSRYLEAVDASDLVVVAGAGGLTDAFASYAFAFLETLELALDRGTPVALMGQGIGPMKSAQLRRRTRSVLRRVSLIALREEAAGRPLLREMAVPDDRIVTTGDDAIELAYERRPPQPGHALGINMRAADYAGVDDAAARAVVTLAEGAAVHLGTEAIPVPISSYDVDSDFRTLRAERPPSYTLWDAIDRVARCRVVVVGSYHAAVFALSMGLPAVCIASSPYYVDKFNGLAAQFGVGCHVELLGDRFEERLNVAIEAAWSEADDVRDRLLRAAERQIAAGCEAYHRLHEVIGR